MFAGDGPWKDPGRVISPRALTWFSWGPFYYHGLTLIPAWINNHTPSNVWDEFIGRFPNVGIYKLFYPILYNGCNYLFMLEIHVKKRGLWNISISPSQHQKGGWWINDTHVFIWQRQQGHIYPPAIHHTEKYMHATIQITNSGEKYKWSTSDSIFSTYYIQIILLVLSYRKVQQFRVSCYSYMDTCLFHL